MAALLSAVVPMPIAILVSIVARVWFSLNELIWLIISSRLVSVYAATQAQAGRADPGPGPTSVSSDGLHIPWRAS